MSHFITSVFHKPFKNGSVFCELTDEGADLLSYKEVVYVSSDLLDEQEHMYNVKVNYSNVCTQAQGGFLIHKSGYKVYSHPAHK